MSSHNGSILVKNTAKPWAGWMWGGLGVGLGGLMMVAFWGGAGCNWRAARRSRRGVRV